MLHPSWIEIDLAQFKKNISAIKNQVGKSLFCLPVKANAYGHGLVQMGKAAEGAGVDYLAVAHLQEGIALREANISLPILVLGAIHEDQIPDFLNFNLEFTISSPFKAELVAKTCAKMGKKGRVHLEVETGMQRTGMRPSTALELFKNIIKREIFEVAGIYSHLACPEDKEITKAQIEVFSALKKEPVFESQPLIWHLASSFAALHNPSSHFDMVRPSLAAFGYGEGMSPCFSLKSRISYFKVVEKGMGISYGHTHVTSKQTRIVTIPIGYGDGYRRALSNRGFVLIRGKKFPIVGTICMDQMMVDIGDHEAYVGDEVVLIGKQGNLTISAFDIATLCETNVYEVLCFFHNRLPRVYTPTD